MEYARSPARPPCDRAPCRRAHAHSRQSLRTGRWAGPATTDGPRTHTRPGSAGGLAHSAIADGAMGRGAAGDTAVGSSYGTISALIFIFNLVVGTGALTLPKAMADAGWLLSVVFLAIVAVFAFISATFVIEAQGAANAVLKSGRVDDDRSGSGLQTFEKPLLGSSSGPGSMYQITERVEVTYMGELLGTPRMRTFFSVMLMVYLYGDLAVYAVAIPTALSSVARLPFDHPAEVSPGGSDSGLVDDDDRLSYSIYLLAFALLTLPIAFFDFQKSSWLQYATCAVRNSAFFTMMAVMAVHTKTDGAGIPPSAHLTRDPIKIAEPKQFPELYGVCVYAFMCHHSLPSIISPIRNKNLVTRIFLVDYIFILLAYIGLGGVSLLAFGGLPDSPGSCPPTEITDEQTPCPVQHLITQNFESFSFQPLAYYLSLYPVFALTTNFPLICITLRNNLQTIVPGLLGIQLQRWQCTLLAALPPYVTAYLYRDVDSLAGITGGYAGVFIQLIIPAILAILARRWESEHPSAGVNVHRSWFASEWWPRVLLVWATLCLLANTAFDIMKLTQHS